MGAATASNAWTGRRASPWCPAGTPCSARAAPRCAQPHGRGGMGRCADVAARQVPNAACRCAPVSSSAPATHHLFARIPGSSPLRAEPGAPAWEVPRVPPGLLLLSAGAHLRRCWRSTPVIGPRCFCNAHQHVAQQLSSSTGTRRPGVAHVDLVKRRCRRPPPPPAGRGAFGPSSLCSAPSLCHAFPTPRLASRALRTNSMASQQRLAPAAACRWADLPPELVQHCAAMLSNTDRWVWQIGMRQRRSGGSPRAAAAASACCAAAAVNLVASSASPAG